MVVASEDANPQCHQRWLENPRMKKMEVEFAGKIIEPLLLIFSSTPCFMVSGITVYHLKFSPPRCNPWCWYIYLQNWVMFWVNVGIHIPYIPLYTSLYLIYSPLYRTIISSYISIRMLMFFFWVNVGIHIPAPWRIWDKLTSGILRASFLRASFR